MSATRAISTVSSSAVLRSLFWLLAGAASGVLVLLSFAVGVMVGAE